jgi:hypothetical protein
MHFSYTRCSCCSVCRQRTPRPPRHDTDPATHLDLVVHRACGQPAAVGGPRHVKHVALCSCAKVWGRCAEQEAAHDTGPNACKTQGWRPGPSNFRRGHRGSRSPSPKPGCAHHCLTAWPLSLMLKRQFSMFAASPLPNTALPRPSRSSYTNPSASSVPAASSCPLGAKRICGVGEENHVMSLPVRYDEQTLHATGCGVTLRLVNRLQARAGAAPLFAVRA